MADCRRASVHGPSLCISNCPRQSLPLGYLSIAGNRRSRRVSLAATTLFAAPVVVIAGGRLFEGGVLLMFNETGESSATELLYEDTFPADYL